MADESCAFPADSGEAPRTAARWLNRATAERLLDGAPLEALDLDPAALDARTADEAAHLVRALAALRALGTSDRPVDAFGQVAGAGPAWAGARTGPVGPAREELPGEAAALAAFRQARDVLWVRDGTTAGGAPATARGADGIGRDACEAAVEIGSVRLRAPGEKAGAGAARADRPRRNHFRLSLVACLAGCMLGGVTVAAATTGILPVPFGGHHGPSPTVSVPPGSPDPAGPSASPNVSGGASGTPGPSGTRSGDDRADGDDGAGPDNGHQDGSNSSEKWRAQMASACKDYRGGKDLDPGTQRQLETAAHGFGRVETFCAALLDSDQGSATEQESSSGGTQDGTDEDGSTIGDAERKGGAVGGEVGGVLEHGDGGEAGDGPQSDGEGGEAGGSGGPSAGRAGGPVTIPSASETPPEPLVTPGIEPGVTFSAAPTQ